MSDPSRRTAIRLATSLGLAAASIWPARATELFVDRFTPDAADVDRSVWTTFEGPAGYIPRTAFRNPAATAGGRGRIAVRDGHAVLVLSRFNPTARRPGDSFWGSHIATRRAFFPPAPDQGIEFATRLRTPERLPPGIVVGVFLFGLTRGAASDHKSELDFELLSSLMRPGMVPRVLLNRYVDERPGAGHPLYLPVPGLDLMHPTDLSLRWFPHQQCVEWAIGGEVIHRETDHVPREPMAVHLNVWAPAPGFDMAFDPGLQPTRSPQDDAHWVVLIDEVRVRTIPSAR